MKYGVVAAVLLALAGVSEASAQGSPLDLLREFTRPLPDLPSLLEPRRNRGVPRRAAAPTMPETLTVLPRLRPDAEDEPNASMPAPDAPSAAEMAGDLAPPADAEADDERFSAVPIAPPGRFRTDAAESDPLAFAPPDDLPVPRFRPDAASAIGGLSVPPTGSIAPATSEEAVTQVAVAAPVAALVPLPRVRPPRPPAMRIAAVPGAPKTQTDPGCAGDLIALGVIADRIDPIRNGACGIDAPYKVTGFAGGRIALSQPATLTCAAALETARWLRDHVGPAARVHLGGEVTGVRVAASYACRTRNSRPGARLSEHALGRAIDVSAIQVSGAGWLVVGSEAGARQRVLLASRRAACGPFKTVLGPGSDAFHDDHFHLDLAQRRRGSVYCKGTPDT